MINRIAVIGAGIMGNGIAQVIGTAGIHVNLYDIDQASLNKAFSTIEKNLDLMTQKSILDIEAKSTILKRISGTTNLKECVSQCDMIIEVVSEILDLKQTLYKQIENIVKDDVIIASNTSAIPLTELTQQAKIPERFIITHFMNPATLVPLVEIITQDVTDVDVIDRTMQFIKRIGKSPIRLKKEIPGAVVNRLQAALLREAFHLVEQDVVSLQDIDQIIKDGPGFRWAFIGPMQMVDLGGLDTWKRIIDHLSPVLEDSKTCSSLVQQLVENGRLGTKAGKGIFDYDDNLLERIIFERDRDFIELLKLRNPVDNKAHTLEA
ncbi:3-hydroxyacyl-CoA dehydrogenase family protein [Peribacillus butanolivorans]|uniref:3-hydroxyacyl-CoA dehydrogenase family protein n=1 Tax=Peribacillus butanolivorans TaxID=421767 RepID=UPI0036DC26F8